MTMDIEQRKKLDLRSGNTVKVWQKIQEKGKTRLQAFEGLIIASKHGKEPGATFTVRKICQGIGVERIFPLFSPNIDNVEIMRRSKARRTKLYYIRDKAAKEIRRKMKLLVKTIKTNKTEEEKAPVVEVTPEVEEKQEKE